LRDVSTAYILSVMSATRAKLFQNGGSQAVRLPRECRVAEGQREVLVRREGERVILEPVDEWPQAFRACLGAWTQEIERPKQRSIQKLRDPFA
jgi:virulence-associated protein VagC